MTDIQIFFLLGYPSGLLYYKLRYQWGVLRDDFLLGPLDGPDIMVIERLP